MANARRNAGLSVSAISSPVFAALFQDAFYLGNGDDAVSKHSTAKPWNAKGVL
jgi:hypothetical protein